MSYKFEGNNYDWNLSLKEIAQKVREFTKRHELLSQCKWSVRTSYASMCQSLSIKLMEAPFDAFKDSCNEYSDWNKYHDEEENDLFTQDAMRVMMTIRDFVESFNKTESDPYTDYYSTNFYSDYSVGNWDKPFKKRSIPKKPTKSKKTEGLKIIDYSDKSFVVVGDTKPIKDLLLFLGGKFNPRLRIDERVGWIFPMDKKELVADFFGI